MATDDNMSDDVFEASDNHKNALAIGEIDPLTAASPSGYPGYKPPKEALRMYAMENDYFTEPTKSKVAQQNDGDEFDGWQSYKIDDGDNVFDENIVHKVGINLEIMSMYN